MKEGELIDNEATEEKNVILNDNGVTVITQDFYNFKSLVEKEVTKPFSSEDESEKEWESVEEMIIALSLMIKKVNKFREETTLTDSKTIDHLFKENWRLTREIEMLRDKIVELTRQVEEFRILSVSTESMCQMSK